VPPFRASLLFAANSSEFYKNEHDQTTGVKEELIAVLIIYLRLFSDFALVFFFSSSSTTYLSLINVIFNTTVVQ